MRTVLLIYLVTISNLALAGNTNAESQKDRKPSAAGGGSLASVEVSKIGASKLDIAEKWLDKANGVVCYVGQFSVSNSTAAQISCFRVDNPQ